MIASGGWHAAKAKFGCSWWKTVPGNEWYEAEENERLPTFGADGRKAHRCCPAANPASHFVNRANYSDEIRPSYCQVPFVRVVSNVFAKNHCQKLAAVLVRMSWSIVWVEASIVCWLKDAGDNFQSRNQRLLAHLPITGLVASAVYDKPFVNDQVSGATDQLSWLF